jgi:hypothetical protein
MMATSILHDPFEPEESKKKNVHFDQESTPDVTFNEV